MRCLFKIYHRFSFYHY